MTNAQDIITFTDVEAGFARINRNGRYFGRVSEHKHGSTRTGTIWTAKVTGINLVATGYTRSEAVANLVAAYNARRASMGVSA